MRGREVLDMRKITTTSRMWNVNTLKRRQTGTKREAHTKNGVKGHHREKRERRIESSIPRRLDRLSESRRTDFSDSFPPFKYSEREGMVLLSLRRISAKESEQINSTRGDKEDTKREESKTSKREEKSRVK